MGRMGRMNHIFSRVIAYCGYNIIYMNIIIYLRDCLFMHARSVRKEFMKNEKSSVHPTLHKKKPIPSGQTFKNTPFQRQPKTLLKRQSGTLPATKRHFTSDKTALYQRQSGTLLEVRQGRPTPALPVREGEFTVYR